MEYTVRRSAKRRTLAIRITKDGDCIVYAPRGASDAEIRRFFTAHTDWVIKNREKVLVYRALHPEKSESEIRVLKECAAEYLPKRVSYFAPLLGVKVNSVRISSAKTRFGSCNSKGNISFSYRLMEYPPEAIDYVVVHELAHRREMNHSPRFYAIVKSIMPDYRERAKLLKR